jgi:ABC-type transport system substrate-binding protein
MKRIALPSLVLISALLLSAVDGGASSNPRYGGTLRIEIHVTNISLDPREWQPGSLEAAADEKLAALVFERLVALDDFGRFQPVLALDWSHDAASKRWQFPLRPGVRFSDGSPLNAADVVAALQPLLPDSLQISAAGNVVVIQSTSPVPDLLEQLASGRYFIYRAEPGNGLVGTGPFVKQISAQASHLSFRENDDAWSGRPFLDAIDVTLGVPPLRAMFDLQLGRADLIELSPDLVSRLTQANLRVWSSEPLTLYGLRFDDAQSAASDSHLREALSLSLDRSTMANVLLQKQAQPAAALLPQWLSGYAFLFNVDGNLERAKELRRALPANAAAAADPLRLHVDPSGDLPKLLGERVAVNARQAAILVQVSTKPVAHTSSATNTPADPPSGVHLFAWHYSSLSARAELDSMLAAYNLSELSEASATTAATSSTDHEQLYARERRVLEGWRIVPLIEQPEFVGLGPTVRDWLPARWGEWRLADVWLDTSVQPADLSNSPSATPGAPQ